MEEIPNPKSQALNKSKIRNPKLKTKAVAFDKIPVQKKGRISSGIGELDRVLGGGVLKGSVVLIAGEPGIGKSTMMLQIASSLSNSGTVLYVSGEESPQQIKFRADRLGVKSSGLILLTDTDLFSVEEEIARIKPGYIIIDSIQTIEREDISSGAGSVAQVKECAAYLVRIAKENDIPTFIVGQVTKEGSVAGPRILEHMVDTVLYFEGEQTRRFRILRSVKNRFGSTNEIGIFEMSELGLKEISDPSGILTEGANGQEPGAVITVAVEGTRPLLVEIQSLVSFSKMPYPKRTVTGLDFNRSSMIMGVLERKAGIKLSEQEIYLSVASGLHVEEPAVDLAVAFAIVSCYKNKALLPKTIVLGEIGLTGEIRGVNFIEQRIKEAQRMGFEKAVIPALNMPQLEKFKGIKLRGISNIREALEEFK